MKNYRNKVLGLNPYSNAANIWTTDSIHFLSIKNNTIIDVRFEIRRFIGNFPEIGNIRSNILRELRERKE